jgi:hypothetical protein
MRLEMNLSYSLHEPMNLEKIHHVPFSSNHYRMKTLSFKWVETPLLFPLEHHLYNEHEALFHPKCGHTTFFPYFTYQVVAKYL